MHIHFIIHEAFEAPGIIKDWAFLRDHVVTYTRIFEEEKLPDQLTFDLLIIMGGPQSPSTTKEECHYFDGLAEMSFIKRSVDGGKKVLGICLGAQLIGESLGGKYCKSTNKEIGVFEVSLTEDGAKHPFLTQFPKHFKTGHWHNDMPGLTQNAKVLATSKGCPRQIIEFTPKVFGFQCHMEFTKENVMGMISHFEKEFDGHEPFVQDKNEFVNANFSEMNQLLINFLDHLVAE